MKRRQLLKRAALLGASGFVTVGTHGWALRKQAKAAAGDPRLIVIFLRGAADGLNIVVPYQESHYYEARPSVAIARPGQENGAIDLDGQFGLHPALQPLMPMWQSGQLAFVPAAGSSVVTRSHFQAQDYMESGTPGELGGNPNGWLNRMMATLPAGTPTQAVNIGTTLPLIFSGTESVANLAVGRSGSRPLPIDRPQIQTAFDRLYANDPRLSAVYHEGRAARDIVLTELAQENEEASRGAPTPQRFATSAQYLARLMSGDAATQVAFMEVGDWDTHVNQRGRLNRNLGLLGEGLATLKEGLGSVYENTTVVVLSEFGRTIAENGNGGTEHGYGNAMWLMGGRVKGGELYGDWPGLAPANQHESRDLMVTTDYRDVMTAVLAQQFGLDGDAIAQIFPNYQQQVNLSLIA
ncbi:MAG: DUF1501 domain-containing protein [Cyanobacteria bacterium J06607_10]